jgi:hypothetical protein
MNDLLFSHPFSKGLRLALLLALLLFNFGTRVAYAAPSNDNFANATVVGAIAYVDSVDTTTASIEGNDPQPTGECDDALIKSGWKSVWYKYTAATKGIIEADTIGSDAGTAGGYDTYIAVWTGTALTNLTFVACDDDVTASKDAQVTFRAKAGITYYVEVATYRCSQTPSCIDEADLGGNLIFHMNIGGGPDTTGVFRPSNGVIFLKNTNASGFADVALNYGLGGDYPVVGDWDGNGTVTIGVYRNGSFYLRNFNTKGFADLVFPFGAPGDQPVAGDWDGNGTDTIGVYRSSTGTFYLRNSNTTGPPQMSFVLGNPGDIAIAGDWNGDGTDTTGVFRPSNGALFLKNINSSGFADVAINYGLPGDFPVVGDWDGNGTTTIGVYRNGQFLLRNSNDLGFANIVFNLGNPGDMPIAGNWDGIP